MYTEQVIFYFTKKSEAINKEISPTFTPKVAPTQHQALHLCTNRHLISHTGLFSFYHNPGTIYLQMPTAHLQKTFSLASLTIDISQVDNCISWTTVLFALTHIS